MIDTNMNTTNKEIEPSIVYRCPFCKHAWEHKDLAELCYKNHRQKWHVVDASFSMLGNYPDTITIKLDDTDEEIEYRFNSYRARRGMRYV